MVQQIIRYFFLILILILILTLLHNVKNTSLSRN